LIPIRIFTQQQRKLFLHQINIKGMLGDKNSQLVSM
jgi:hypothetical protein